MRDIMRGYEWVYYQWVRLYSKMNSQKERKSSLPKHQEQVYGRVRSTSSLPKYTPPPLHEGSRGYTRQEARDSATEETREGAGENRKDSSQANLGIVAWGQVGIGSQLKAVTAGPSIRRVVGGRVHKLAVGHQHLVYLTHKNQAYGLGASHFGQLAYTQALSSTQPSITPTPIMQQLIVTDVFCTPFTTFLLTNRGEVYGMGLNNRGQLGMPMEAGEGQAGVVSAPRRIGSISRRPLVQNIDGGRQKSGSKAIGSNRKVLQSYVLAQHSPNTHNMPTLETKLHTEKSSDSGHPLQTHFSDELPPFQQPEPSLLDDDQMISDITGGPYHTIALTNKGRVFYSGNVYKKSAILSNEYLSEFTEINLKKIGRVRKIGSGLTVIGLLNTAGHLYLLGALSEGVVCDEPYNVGVDGVQGFGLGAGRLAVVTDSGEGWLLEADRKSLRTYGLAVGGDKGKSRVKLVDVQCGVDFCVLTDDMGQLYGEGNNHANIFGPEYQHPPAKESSQATKKICKINTDNMKITKVLTNTNGVYALCGGIDQCQVTFGDYSQVAKQNAKNQMNRNNKDSTNLKEAESNEILLRKIRQLQKQNRNLRQMAKEDDSKMQMASGRKRQMSSSSTFGNNPSLMKKISGNENTNGSNSNNKKFQMHYTISEKVMTKARKFDSSMEIPFEELQLGKQISQGGYGIIYKAVWRKTTVAVKIFKIDPNSQNSIKDFVSECHAMQAFRHPNIVMFLGACTKPPNFAIVLQYCEGGTLWSILQKSGELSWELRRRLALDTARGMNYLHERPIPVLHRDLKSLNLLLDENKRVKLADFGWTKGLQNYMTGKIGTYQWMAPEVVSSHQYTEKADVFSFGIILWEIASRQAPYRNIPGVQVAQDVLNKDLRPSIPKRTPQPFATLMRRCWAKSPQTRPSFVQIVEQLQSMQLPN